MAPHPHAWAAVAMVLVLALGAALWPQPRAATPPGVRLSRVGATAVAQPARAAFPTAPPEPAPAPDPLLAPALRHTLELLLLEAGPAVEPSELKQRLAAQVDAHFPATLAARALALAGRYLDYRVALGAAKAPPHGSDPAALRQAMQARDALRRQFFDEAERAALFAREDELDRYTLARLEAALAPGQDAAQRGLALQTANGLLTEERQGHYRAITAHLAAAGQTADFEARKVDPATRLAARTASYGAAAAQALAALDREEQQWQQRLDQYSQALAQPGSDGAALRRQLFSAQELPRIDAALTLRQLGSPG